MFAIRQKSTGFYMPAFSKNQKAGGTWLEPRAHCVPRLFSRKQDAAAAISHWLKGRLTVYRDWRTDESDDDWVYKPDPSRKAEDMQIVEVVLIPADRLANLERAADGYSRLVYPDTTGQ